MKRVIHSNAGRKISLFSTQQLSGAWPMVASLRQALVVLLLLPALALGFEVNSEGDEPDDDLNDGNCAIAVTGLCTLRAAIQQANADPTGAPYRITFADSVQTIVLESALPAIDVPIEINGQRSDMMNPRVELDGNQRSGGISFNASASQDFDPSPAPGAPRAGVFNMVIHNFNHSGIDLSGRGYTIQNNYIGVLPDGNTASRNLNHGIRISAPIPDDPLPPLPDFGDLDLENIDAVQAALIAALALVNPPVTINGNLISGNGQDGVHVTGIHTALVFIRGNRIGTNADGDAAIPNGSDAQGSGVRIQAGSFANIIGPFNLISGNNRANSGANGIDLVADAVRFPNFIAGNLIGPGDLDPFNFDPTDPGDDPFSDLGNLNNGIRVQTSRATSAPANPTPYSVVIGPANLIAFNGTSTPGIDLNNVTEGAGILIDGSTEDAYVFGNVIGGLRFEVLGAPVTIGGNKSDGIIVTRPNNRIGGTSLAERNTISGNLRHGISLRVGTTRNVTIQGNLIGRDPLNFFNAGNAGDGIHINAASLITIGGSADGAANVIAGSGRNGVKVTNGSTSQGWANLISRNQIFDNGASGGGIGIDLERTQNAPDPTEPLGLPNNWANQAQTAPVICSGLPGDPAQCGGADGPGFDTGSNQITLRAVLQANPNRDQIIEIFLTDAPGNFGNGEGREFLESRSVTTDGSGFAVIDITASAPPGGAAGQRITLTATDVTETTRPGGSMGPANNSSEFSGAIAISTPGSIEFDPDSLDFGPVQVGNSADLTTNLQHVAGDAVTGITLGISGAGFSIQATTCPAPPFSLAPGEDCEVTVRFAPGGSGSPAGSLTATPASGDPAVASLSGIGEVGGSLVFDDPALDFNGVIVGQSTTLTTTLRNPGESSVNNIEVNVTGAAFTRDGGSCVAGQSLAGGATCTVIVRFTPTTPDPATGTLAATGDEDSTSIGLEGVGLAPAAISLDQMSYDFGTVTVGNFSERTAILGNSGDVPATGLDVDVSGTGFSRVGGSCALVLNGGDDCSIVMRFEPALPGNPPGDLVVSADDGLSASAPLQGEAVAPGDLLFDPAVLAFPDVTIGQSETRTTDLRNSGGSPISGITLSISGPGFAIAGSSCDPEPFTLGPGEDCELSVSFTPTSTVAANGTLGAGGSGATTTASLSGNGQMAGSLAFDDPALDFNGVIVGQSTTLTTTLRNPGESSVNNIEVNVTGAAFTRDGGSCLAGQSLAGGATCTVIMRFTPTTPDPATGTLAATGDEDSTSIGLEGVGLAPAAISLDQMSYDFGTVTVGNFSERTAILSNSGDVPATGLDVDVSGTGFSRVGGSCALVLNGGDDCSIVMRFQPALPGNPPGDLVVSADDGLSASAPLQGEAVAPGDLLFDPAVLAFPDVIIGQSETRTTDLRNSGGSPISGITLSISGAGFAIAGSSCDPEPFTLGPGEDCELSISFTPTSTVPANGTLSATPASASAALASLSGNGVTPGALAFDPATLPFGDIVIGQTADLSTTLSNSGGIAVDDIVLAVSGASFSRNGGDCPLGSFSLAAGTSCSVVIRFTPTGAGPATGTLSATPGSGAAASAGLSGSGTVETPVQFDPPGGLQFGQLEVGASSTLSLLISNSGSQALDALLIAVEGPFNLVGNDCPASLPAGASCSLQIEFAPGSAGSFSGLVRVRADGGIDVTAGLSGSAIQPGGPGVPGSAIPVPATSPVGLLALLLALLLLAARQHRRLGQSG